jgi:hypothetical protein
MMCRYKKNVPDRIVALSVALGARAGYENDIEFASARMISLSQPCIVPCFQVQFLLFKCYHCYMLAHESALYTYCTMI